jgi:hypothetical protein
MMTMTGTMTIGRMMTTMTMTAGASAAIAEILGREIDSRGDRSLGTILGAAGGALLGREIERGRCR